jgi:hypothetical protein
MIEQKQKKNGRDSDYDMLYEEVKGGDRGVGVDQIFEEEVEQCCFCN